MAVTGDAGSRRPLGVRTSFQTKFIISSGSAGNRRVQVLSLIGNVLLFFILRSLLNGYENATGVHQLPEVRVEINEPDSKTSSYQRTLHNGLTGWLNW